MDLDRLIHAEKHFAELDDSDIETFLRERKFGSEHLNVEFKSAFPQRQANKYEIKNICKYIVGFSNEEGGLVLYGVADSIKDVAVVFPAYVTGLTHNPRLEDLSQWVKERVHPLIASPAIRFFSVAGKEIAVLKIPQGVNKPYFYYEPDSQSLTYFKKTAGGIAALAPDEVREFYRSQIIEQSQIILKAVGHEPSASMSSGGKSESLAKHARSVISKLEGPKDFGLIQIYCTPEQDVVIPVQDLHAFLERHRLDFSEAMRFFRIIDVFQSGVSVGYFPNAVRQDVKSAMRVSLYSDGLCAYDSLADTLLDGDHALHAGWLCYEIQRHLQPAKALLTPLQASRLHVTVDLKYIEQFRLQIPMTRTWAQFASYTGSHEPIERKVRLDEIHDYDGDKRNIVIPVVGDIMGEVGRIFGLSQAPRNLWDESGYLWYVKGLEPQR